MHAAQVIAAAAARKHIFCEKPFALTKESAEQAVNAAKNAGVTLGLGYNRRFHPEITKLRARIRTGELGTILHVEATMTFANALMLKPDAWRADPHGDPVRRPHADGGSRDRRHDRLVRPYRPRIRPEFPARRRG